MKKQFWHKQMFCVNTDVWRVDVVVSINMSGKETYRKLRRWKIPAKSLIDAKKMCDEWDNDEDSIDGRMYKLSGGFLVFLNMPRTKFRQAVGTLVHEMTHVTHYLLRDRRIPLSEDTEEAHTYLVQYLTTEALKRMY